MIMKYKTRHLGSNRLMFPFRSTLCSVMAQLTEDIQPSFETTLKSKAVSENCNVKFTCVVSGRPCVFDISLLVLFLFCFFGASIKFHIGRRRQDVTNLEKMSIK